MQAALAPAPCPSHLAVHLDDPMDYTMTSTFFDPPAESSRFSGALLIQLENAPRRFLSTSEIDLLFILICLVLLFLGAVLVVMLTSVPDTFPSVPDKTMRLSPMI